MRAYPGSVGLAVWGEEEGRPAVGTGVQVLKKVAGASFPFCEGDKGGPPLSLPLPPPSP